MKRTFVALVLAVVLVLALAAPALAQVLFHTATYEMEGVIDFKKQAGHFCNTGAEIKQTIAGSGKMDKTQTITQVKGKITMGDTNDWVAGATPLTVTTVWKLCTPPKYTYDGISIPLLMAGSEDGEITAPVGLTSLYSPAWDMPAVFEADPVMGFTGVTDSVTVPALAAVYGWDALTEQYWAVQVKADPGFSGNIHQKGEAAYGGFWGSDGIQDYEDGWDKDLGFLLLDKSNTWRWALDEDGVLFPQVGADFVGDYFNMEQMARTSQGTLKRYIDISSPWSHGYLHEDMSVVGKSMITEAFKLVNLPAGADIPGDWWKLF